MRQSSSTAEPLDSSSGCSLSNLCSLYTPKPAVTHPFTLLLMLSWASACTVLICNIAGSSVSIHVNVSVKTPRLNQAPLVL